MSGGSLNYFYCDLESHVGDFGDKELDNLVGDLAKLFHDREWFLSSDIGEGDWEEARSEFKEKWFTQHGRQERIEKYLDTVRNEVFSSFGMSIRYCKNCKHWTKEDDKGSPYGCCDFEKTCLMHRSESCDKFEQKQAAEGAERWKAG